MKTLPHDEPRVPETATKTEAPRVIHEVVPFNIYRTLPFEYDEATMPHGSPMRLLHDFTTWIVQVTDDATFMLDKMEMLAPEIEERALQTACVMDYSPENSLSGSRKFPERWVNNLEAFLTYHLAKARLSRLIERCRPFRALAFQWIREHELPTDLEERFKSLFSEYQQTEAEYLEKWCPGVSGDDMLEAVLEALWENHQHSGDPTREQAFEMWTRLNEDSNLSQI